MPLKTLIDMYNSSAYLILTMSLDTQIKENGVYKISNNLNTLKKSIFFCILLKNFFSRDAKTI